MGRSREVHPLQGFRKIDSDKWEFANEAFRRGEKHLLKNIQRRRTLQSQQTVSYTGPSTKAGKLELESEIETLRRERGEIMQEVVHLQQQQRGSVHHMEAVNQRLQAAEQRQKQMVSFLAKLFQNPAFIARLKQTKEQRDNIGSPRMKRKFVKHQAHEPTESPMEGQVIKYLPELEFQIENLRSSELEAAQGFMDTPVPFGEGTSNDPLSKGKSVMSSPLPEFSPEYFVTSPKEKDFPELSGIVKEEDIWSMGFESETGMLNSSQEMWGNIGSYDVPEIVSSSGGFSDIWDLGPLQGAGSSGTKWPSDENEPESHSDQTNNEK